MSSTAPIIASSSSTMSLPSREMTDNRLFQFYLESFFKIPKDISHDIIYCQRALKAHIKVHQMVLDVFQQQPDADPEQKRRILEELEAEIYEINAEQSFLFLRLRRIVDEFMKMLIKNDIPTDADTTNAFISKELVPLINDNSLIILPTTVILRNSEEQLIEKYFEVQKDSKEQDEPNIEHMEIIDLDDDDATIAEIQNLTKTHDSSRFDSKKDYVNSTTFTGESLLKTSNGVATANQPSLLKPFNQRITNDLMNLDFNPSVDKPVKTLGDLYNKKKKADKFFNQKVANDLISADIIKPKTMKSVKTLGDLYQQKKEQKEKEVELPVSTNVKMSRMNLRQALKRAQAAVRGPSSMTTPTPSLPPPAPVQSSSSVGIAEVVKKPALSKTKATRTAIAAAAGSTVSASSSRIRKSPGTSSSSDDSTPERGPTPHNYWPDEFEETRTKAEEYGQEMFLRLFDLFTPEIHAQLQQRRSKRRRRCVQNNNYHYGRIEHHPIINETEAKKKRKTFLLSPQVKKALPAKRAKRRSADNVSETISAQTSRSASSSPDEKRSCNDCLQAGLNLEQCEECKFYYHAQCHNKDDDPLVTKDPKKDLDDLKKCPGCKRKYENVIKEGVLLNQNLQRCAQDLELKFAKEKDRNEILERTGKSYKIQMNNLFKIVNSLKDESSTSNSGNAHDIDGNEVIHLD